MTSEKQTQIMPILTINQLSEIFSQSKYLMTCYITSGATWEFWVMVSSAFSGGWTSFDRNPGKSEGDGCRALELAVGDIHESLSNRVVDILTHLSLYSEFQASRQIRCMLPHHPNQLKAGLHRGLESAYQTINSRLDYKLREPIRWLSYFRCHAELSLSHTLTETTSCFQSVSSAQSSSVWNTTARKETETNRSNSNGWPVTSISCSAAAGGGLYHTQCSGWCCCCKR